MSHSYVKIWIHLIFGTKNRDSLILDKFETNLHQHLSEQLKSEFESPVKIINGTHDHVHLLFQLSQNHSISTITKNIKGESSHWLNSNDFTKTKFAWQTGYGAFSVSNSKVATVEKYIYNQKNHHKKVTFQEEYESFMKNYGFFEENR